MDPDNNLSDPHRGGNDSNLGVFLGGAQLDDSYVLKPDCKPYQCALQLRNNKALLRVKEANHVTVSDWGFYQSEKPVAWPRWMDWSFVKARLFQNPKL